MLGEKLTKLRRCCGYSQQQVADAVGVSRQTIANWEVNQGAPALDKAARLAELYRVTLDDLVRDEVEVAASRGASKTSGPRVLEGLRGAMCRITADDNIDWLLAGGSALTVRVLDVDENWLRVEYERTRPDALTKKERVVQLVDVRDVVCVAVVEEPSGAEPAGSSGAEPPGAPAGRGQDAEKPGVAPVADKVAAPAADRR